MIVSTPNDLFEIYPLLNEDVKIKIHQFHNTHSDKIIKVINGLLHRIHKNQQIGIHINKNNYFVKNNIEPLKLTICIYYTNEPFEILNIFVK